MEKKHSSSGANKSFLLKALLVVLLLIAIAEGIFIYYLSDYYKDTMPKTTQTETDDKIEMDSAMQAALDSFANVISKDTVEHMIKYKNIETGMTLAQEWWCNLSDDWKIMFIKKEDLDDNKMPTKQQLASILRTEEIDIAPYKDIQSLRPVKQLHNLKSLNCSHLKINSLEPLKTHKQLKKLDCTGTEISSLEPIADLTQLEVLKCSRTNITTLEPIKNLANLIVFQCANTQITSLEPLSDWNLLESIDFSHTKVNSLKPLSNLLNLNTINCSHTRVSNLLPLFHLSNLKTLLCYNTKIGNLDPLYNLDKLNILYYNDISQEVIDDFRMANPKCTVLKRDNN